MSALTRASFLAGVSAALTPLPARGALYLSGHVDRPPGNREA